MRTALVVILSLVLGDSAAAQRGRDRGRTPREEEKPVLEVSQAAARGCELLLELQEEGDRWPYEGVYRVRVEGKQGRQIPIGYEVGGTAICGMALVETPGYAEDEKRRAAVEQGIAFILTALQDPLMDASFKRGYDVRGWGHTYALLFFLRLDELELVPGSFATQIAEATQGLVTTLQKSEIAEGGGWNYSRRGESYVASSPFMTAPTLQALFLAQSRGHAVDPKVVERGLVALERARTASGGYEYSSPQTAAGELAESELSMMHRRPGSVARMSVVESTLHLAGRGNLQRLYAAIDAFFTHWDELEVRRRQPRTHEPPYGVAPYYYFFGHYYVAQAIELLPDPIGKDEYRARLNRILASIQEESGGWNDRVFPRSENYGTAMAIMALQMKDIPPIPPWQSNGGD